MKMLLSFCGVFSALLGLVSCSTVLDDESIVGEWGISYYTYVQDSVEGDWLTRDPGYTRGYQFTDPDLMHMAFVFDEDGSGKNVSYGYVDEIDGEQQFVEDYCSYPFKWTLDNGKLVLNYTGEEPQMPEPGPFEGTSIVKKYRAVNPVGTEFETQLLGKRLILKGHWTVLDGVEAKTEINLVKK